MQKDKNEVQEELENIEGITKLCSTLTEATNGLITVAEDMLKSLKQAVGE